MSWIHSIRGYVRVILDTRPTDREFRRIGLDDETLVARASDIDAATPTFAQTRGKAWAEVGPASSAFLALLRRVPSNAGADALITEFHAASRRGHV